MGIFRSLLKGLGFEDTNEELASYKKVENRPLPTYLQQTTEDKRLVTVKPKSFEDIELIIEALLLGECSIIDLSDISGGETEKLLDFLSGAVYALKADLKRLQGDLFLLIPNGIKLNNFV